MITYLMHMFQGLPHFEEMEMVLFLLAPPKIPFIQDVKDAFV